MDVFKFVWFTFRPTFESECSRLLYWLCTQISKGMPLHEAFLGHHLPLYWLHAAEGAHYIKFAQQRQSTQHFNVVFYQRPQIGFRLYWKGWDSGIDNVQKHWHQCTFGATLFRPELLNCRAWLVINVAPQQKRINPSPSSLCYLTDLITGHFLH